mmetsp:Transcript_12990/g.39986  ORF Transcript_12990/g.39986 Transcript_12990/m.39986 type:complete len:176 (+) Transcript_12990:171-698(+)
MPDSQSGEVDGLLPRGSIVQIVGNNRTKWNLVGKRGVVKNAQTLGGWHEVLLDGTTSVVRVQRNALETISTFPDPGEEMSPNSIQVKTASAARKHKRKLSSRESIDFGRLNEDTLRRYRKFFNLNVRKDCERDELVFAVKRHFARTKVNESDVILHFLRKVGRSNTSSTSQVSPL